MLKIALPVVKIQFQDHLPLILYPWRCEHDHVGPSDCVGQAGFNLFECAGFLGAGPGGTVIVGADYVHLEIGAFDRQGQ